MSKERLSELQKWILEECIKDWSVVRNTGRGFYGKWFSPKRVRLPCFKNEKKYFNWWTDRNGKERFSPKEELISTRSIEATISRAMRNLVEKGWLVKEGFLYRLTEKGWPKVNENRHTEIDSFKEYKKGADKKREDMMGWVSGINRLGEAAGLPKKRSIRDRELRAAREAANKIKQSESEVSR